MIMPTATITLAAVRRHAEALNDLANVFVLAVLQGSEIPPHDEMIEMIARVKREFDESVTLSTTGGAEP
jgi:hypothetical protein